MQVGLHLNDWVEVSKKEVKWESRERLGSNYENLHYHVRDFALNPEDDIFERYSSGGAL